MSATHNVPVQTTEQLLGVRRRLRDSTLRTPAAGAEELVAQIAAAVQGLSEVSAWREEVGVG